MNGNISFETVYLYLTGPGSLKAHAPKGIECTLPPHCTVLDFLTTLRMTCYPAVGAGLRQARPEEMAFVWPSGKTSFLKALATALYHLPPGHMVLIKSAKRIPRRFYEKDGRTLKTSVMEVYHGCGALTSVKISGEALRK